MNTLDDLRATLERHAGTLSDPGLPGRSTAVRARVRTVRRRRTAVASVATVVAVAGVAAVGGVVGGQPAPQPAHRVAGMAVPERVTVYGFPYKLERTRTITPDDHGTRLSGADGWQAVSLVASGLGTGFATLFVDGEPVARAAGDGDVEVPVPVYDGTPTMRVRLDGAPADARAGLAVYGATGGLPPGVTNGHAVFREQVGGSRLRAGAFSQPGDAELTVPVTGDLSGARFAGYCRTDATGLWLNLGIGAGHDGSLQSSCGRSDVIDAGTGGYTLDGPAPAGAHAVRAWLTRGPDGPRVAAPDAVLGVAVYDRGSPSRRVLGMDVDTTVEADGQTWRLERVEPQATAGRALTTTVDASDGDRLLGHLATGGMTWLTWRGDLLHGESSRMGNATNVHSTGMAIEQLLPGGDRYQVTVAGSADPKVRVALLVYRPE